MIRCHKSLFPDAKLVFSILVFRRVSRRFGRRRGNGARAGWRRSFRPVGGSRQSPLPDHKFTPERERPGEPRPTAAARCGHSPIAVPHRLQGADAQGLGVPPVILLGCRLGCARLREAMTDRLTITARVQVSFIRANGPTPFAAATQPRHAWPRMQPPGFRPSGARPSRSRDAVPGCLWTEPAVSKIGPGGVSGHHRLGFDPARRRRRDPDRDGMLSPDGPECLRGLQAGGVSLVPVFRASSPSGWGGGRPVLILVSRGRQIAFFISTSLFGSSRPRRILRSPRLTTPDAAAAPERTAAAAIFTSLYWAKPVRTFDSGEPKEVEQMKNFLESCQMNAPLHPARQHPCHCAPSGSQRRGVCRPRWGVSGLCHGASAGAGAVASGPAKRAAGGAPLAGRGAAAGAADAARASARRADRGRGRAGLSGAFGRGGRDPRQPHGAELYRHPPACLAGRGAWRHPLADPPCGTARTQRAARPLAGDGAALGAEPGRCRRSRRAAVAGGTAARTRQAAGRLGGQP